MTSPTGPGSVMYRGHFYALCRWIKEAVGKTGFVAQPCAPMAKSVGYCQRPVLICLQGNFLSEHDISRDQLARGYEAQTYYEPAIVSNLDNVLGCTSVDSVSFSAVPTDYFETA